MINTIETAPVRRHPIECPGWCAAGPTGSCDGDHHASDEGTVATAGRAPRYAGAFDDRPRYDVVSVTPQHPAAEGLVPSVQVLIVTDGQDLSVELTLDEARRLGRQIQAAADLVDGRPGVTWPPVD